MLMSENKRKAATACAEHQAADARRKNSHTTRREREPGDETSTDRTIASEVLIEGLASGESERGKKELDR